MARACMGRKMKIAPLRPVLPKCRIAQIQLSLASCDAFTRLDFRESIAAEPARLLIGWRKDSQDYVLVPPLPDSPQARF